MRTILVATDGSRSSQHAVAEAAALAVTCGADLVALNVVGLEGANAYREFAEVELAERPANLEPSLPTAVAPGGTAALEFMRLRDTHSYAMDQLISERTLDAAEQTAKAAGVTALRRLSSSGHTANEIVRVADSLDADLVVMGRRGLNPVVEFLLGSITQKVLHLTKRTVMVVS